MCSTLSKLILKTPFNSELQSELYCWLFEGIKSLLISADPAARILTNQAFFVAAQQIRNRCSTCSLEDLDKLTVQHWTGVNGYPSFGVEYSGKTVVSPLEALGKIPVAVFLISLVDVYRFASTLWSNYASRPNISTKIPITGLSPFMMELLSHSFLPPGMPYQRQKMLILLISSMFELSFIENSKTKDAKKSGFEPCKLKIVFVIFSF